MNEYSEVYEEFPDSGQPETVAETITYDSISLYLQQISVIPLLYSRAGKRTYPAGVFGILKIQSSAAAKIQAKIS